MAMTTTIIITIKAYCAVAQTFDKLFARIFPQSLVAAACPRAFPFIAIQIKSGLGWPSVGENGFQVLPQ